MKNRNCWFACALVYCLCLLRLMRHPFLFLNLRDIMRQGVGFVLYLTVRLLTQNRQEFSYLRIILFTQTQKKYLSIYTHGL